jgi:hypothetical protein
MDLLPENNAPMHTYEALAGPEYIRLSKLEPALSTDAPLRFTFIQTELSEIEGQYETISYTWGEPKLICPLHVDDGTCVMVTENLDRALRKLRYGDRVRTLWADAVCINQFNDKEKEVQIPLMARIYRGAKRVLAWLDPGAYVGNEEEGIRVLDRLSRRSRQDISVYSESDRPKEPAPLEDHDLEVQTHLREIVNFISLPWFNRLWIVQEVVFNLDVILICGASILSWARLVAALSILEGIPVHGLSIVEREKIDAIRKIGELWRYYSLIDESDRRKDDDIVQLVEDFATYGCTNPLDRIFALYSMTSDLQTVRPRHDWDHVFMEIDYSLSVRQTYQDFACACIRVGRVMSILEAAFCRASLRNSEQWPSWVPDWRVAPRKTELLPTGVRMGSEILEGNLDGIICLGFDSIEHLVDVSNGPIISESFPRLKNGTDNGRLARILQLYRAMCARETHETSAGLFNFLRIIMSDTTAIADSVPVLEQHLQYLLKRPEEAGQPQSVLMEDLIDKLDEIVGDNVFFTACLPKFNERSIGYGSIALEPGDELFPMEAYYPYDFRFTPFPRVVYALIVRPSGKLNSPTGRATCYRLIGSGRLYDTGPRKLHVQRRQEIYDEAEDERADDEGLENEESEEAWSVLPKYNTRLYLA